MEDGNNSAAIIEWLDKHKILEVEIIVCDFAGIARGKLMPRDKFVKALGGNDLRMPDSIFSLTIDGEYALNEFLEDMEADLYLIPEYDSLRLTPWRKKPTASVICNLIDDKNEISKISPRKVLKNVLQ